MLPDEMQRWLGNLLPLAAWLAIGAMMAVVPELQAQTEPFRIMPVGDSITVGYTNLAGQSEVPFTYGYRSGLYTQLTDAGYSVSVCRGFHGASNPEFRLCESGCIESRLPQRLRWTRNQFYRQLNIASWMQADNPRCHPADDWPSMTSTSHQAPPATRLVRRAD